MLDSSVILLFRKCIYYFICKIFYLVLICFYFLTPFDAFCIYLFFLLLQLTMFSLNKFLKFIHYYYIYIYTVSVYEYFFISQWNISLLHAKFSINLITYKFHINFILNKYYFTLRFKHYLNLNPFKRNIMKVCNC